MDRRKANCVLAISLWSAAGARLLRWQSGHRYGNVSGRNNQPRSLAELTASARSRTPDDTFKKTRYEVKSRSKLEIQSPPRFFVCHCSELQLLFMDLRGVGRIGRG